MPLIAWAAIGLVLSFVLSAITMKRPKPKVTTLDDFDVPQIQDGTPHAVVFGEGWLEGWQVLWYGNYRTKKIKAKGGKKK
jgi:hypothetical protein